jgi:hypothetical protein
VARKHNCVIRKTKMLVCGHEQTFSTPVPAAGDVVWCLTCEKSSSVPKRPYKYVYRRRMKNNPRSNNQYTKGRELSGQAQREED